MRMQDYVKYSSEKLGENFKKRDELISGVANLFLKKKYLSITLIASGSSYNALAMIQDSLQEMTKKPVYLHTPEYVMQFGIASQKSTFIVVVSQSGSSTNIINCLQYLQKNDIFAVSLTGNLDSQMSKYSQEIFDYGPGNEYVDYVTVGVQTLVEFFLLLGCKISGLDSQQKEDFYKQLQQTISYQKELMAETEKFIQNNYFALSMRNPTFFCGNGPNYGVAREGALKFQETLKRPAMYYELEEFLHGPDMQLTPNHTVFLIDDMPVSGKTRFSEVFEALKEITPNVFFITSSNHLEKDQRILKTQAVNNWFFEPYYSLPVVQLVAAKMTDELQAWATHPYFDKFDQKIAIKTDDYDEEIKNIRQKWDSDHKS